MASQKYLEYLDSDAWDEKRQATLDRDGWCCTQCGAPYPGAVLHVHHLTYDHIYQEEEADLVTLCDECHTEEHR